MIKTGDVSLLAGEPFVIVKEPKQFAFPTENGNEIYGWQWVAYTNPGNPVAIDCKMGEILKDSFGLVRLSMDKKEGSELWGTPDESYLNKWKGFFSLEAKKKSRPGRVGMIYSKKGATRNLSDTLPSNERGHP